MKSKSFLELAELRKGDYLGVDISNLGCVYSLSLFPSEKLAEMVKNSEPTVFAVSAALIFVVAAVIFVIYDMCVQRRQVRLVRQYGIGSIYTF